MYKNVDIWTYFKDIGGGKMTCNLCKNDYAASGVMQNLKLHLFTKHPNDLGLLPEKMQKGTNKQLLWTYFSKLQGSVGLSVCNLCNKLLSHKSTITNLKVHLSRSHTEAYRRYLENLPLQEIINSELISMDTNNADDSDESEHVTSEIWNYFEQETGGRVRCVVCRASKPNNVDDLRRHLEENHPKLIQVVGLPQDNAGSDQGSVKEDEGTYTEVIYLEEDIKKSPQKPKYIHKSENVKAIKRTSDVHPRRIDMSTDKKRRESSSSDETPLRKSAQSNELDTFMTYIKCLLKQLPRDTCAKLQLDIVNLIMNVKLNSKTNENSMDVSNVSLKVPVISSYATVTENVTNGTQTQSNSAVIDANNRSYVYTEANTSSSTRDDMIDDS